MKVMKIEQKYYLDLKLTLGDGNELQIKQGDGKTIIVEKDSIRFLLHYIYQNYNP